MASPAVLTLPLLRTDADGFARFHPQSLTLNEGNAQAQLSRLFAAEALQWRQSPVGFTSDFHCTTNPQWLIVLQGVMEIGLQDGSWHRFTAGSFFYSDDTLPMGATFNPEHHGHRSRQVGDVPLITAFVRSNEPCDNRVF